MFSTSMAGRDARRYPSSPASLSLTETVQWDAKTFQLPKKLYSTASAPEKNQFLTATLNGVRAANATAATKLAVLNSRFTYHTLVQEVNASLKNILNLATDQESPSIVVTNNNSVFSLQDPLISTLAAKPVALPLTPNAMTPAARSTAYYYSFQVTVNTRNAYDGPDDVAKDANLSETVFIVTTRLHRQATNNAGELSLHPDFTTAVLRSPNNTLQTIHAITGSPPVLGILKKQGQSTTATLDTNEFRTAFTTFHDECRYKIFVVLLRKEFLGSVLLTAGNLQLQLQKVQQMAFDPTTKSYVCQSVDTFYQKFEAVLTMFGFNEPFPIDVPNAFFSSAAPSLRNQADAMDFAFPPPLNTDAPETAQQALDRLRQVKNALLKYEKQLANLNDSLSRHVGPGRSSNRNDTATRAFQASMHPAYMPMHVDEPTYCYDEQNGYETERAYHPNDESPPYEFPHPSTMTYEALMFQATIFASAAEHALQGATGSNFPLTQCWGCKDHSNPTYHTNRFHRWTDCPHRSDRECQDNASKGLQELFQYRRNVWESKASGSPYGPGTASTGTATTTHATFIDNYEAHGFPSKKMLAMICTITDPATLPDVRRSLLRNFKQPDTTSLGTHVAHVPPNHDDSTALTPTRKIARFTTATTNATMNLHFLPLLAPAPRTMVPLLQTQTLVSPKLSVTSLNISQQMPHVRIQVGLLGDTTLLNMVDTGAGLSLGRLDYHKSIYETRPHVVSSFVYLKDSPDMDEFDIGGVDEFGNPTRVTAIITYKTPFHINGSAVTLSYGLSASASTNTILGLPFLRSAQAAILMTGNDDESMICQRLGSTFRIEYSVPFRANKTPNLPSDTHAAYATHPSHVVTPVHVSDSLISFLATLRPLTKALCTPFEDANKAAPEIDDDWLMHLSFPNIE